MKIFRFRSILFFSFLSLFFSCSNDDTNGNNSNNEDVSTESITIDVYENVFNGEEIAKISGSSTEGPVLFELISESIVGALSVDQNTGSLIVANNMAFDTEINSSINARVKVYDKNNSTATSSININLLPITIDASTFKTDLLNTPSNGDVLGVLLTSTNHGTATLKIAQQSVEGALALDENSGEISVLDASLFNPDINPSITAQVKISNKSISTTTNIIINIVSPCSASQLEFENFVDDLVTNQGYNLEKNVDLTTHEYTFTLNKTVDVCSFGYQGITANPYVIEIVDNTNTTIYQGNHTFSTSFHEYIQIPSLKLVPGTYTIRRIQNNYTYLNEIIGHILFEPSGGTFNFPISYNSFMTITSSNFYGTGGPAPDLGLPYITIGFD